jgi:hypothetical protein
MHGRVAGRQRSSGSSYGVLIAAARGSVICVFARPVVLLNRCPKFRPGKGAVATCCCSGAMQFHGSRRLL